MKISVPATSANLGPGFDSVGLAVSCYLSIEVLEESSQWVIEHDLAGVPSDENNLLIKTVLEVAPDLHPHRIKMISDIPLARGLGSSSSVIVAGIELANQLGQLNLSDDDKLSIATKIEGHPDNVAPAIFGNLVVASYINQELNKIVADFPETALVAYVPAYELKTSDSRQALPQELSFKEAVLASSVANMAVAGLLTGDLEMAGRAMSQDRFHEPYRQKLVPEFPEIRELGQNFGAYATYLSGAGPTVMTLLPKDKKEAFILALEKQLPAKVLALEVDRKGVVVEH
ncbi:homoserine kinase [Streptococcus thoraltensis]|uniref:homoserine kinase n=1 Tax=Streptococcus thoraltensis TaxID=55085 RepID=UPI00037BC9D4|nr:homoserine kinase [Streptococcus thoraltensis]MDY4761924.1 homoserine kinase [Streptococcus thoraltensis]